MSDDRIMALEETVAHQTRTIEELSDQVAQQWRLIEQLRRALDSMGDHMADMAEPTPVTRPPHY